MLSDSYSLHNKLGVNDRTKLYSTKEGFEPQPWQINIYYSI